MINTKKENLGKNLIKEVIYRENYKTLLKKKIKDLKKWKDTPIWYC